MLTSRPQVPTTAQAGLMHALHLQDALRGAWGGDEIRVAQGTYKPDLGSDVVRGDRLASFTLRNTVTLKGGYAGLTEPDPDKRDVNKYRTILSGDLAGNDVHVSDSRSLLNEPTRGENSKPMSFIIHGILT